MRTLAWPCRLSMAPFSCATPRLLRVAVDPVVEDERLVAAGQIPGIRLGQVAEGGRETVAAMLARRAAKQTQRILQAMHQGRIALAAEHDLGMLEAGMGEREVIQPMLEQHAGNGDPEPARVGEVGQAHPTPVSWTCGKMTSRAGPCSAFQAEMRRSRVRRTDSLPICSGQRREPTRPGSSPGAAQELPGAVARPPRPNDRRAGPAACDRAAFPACCSAAAGRARCAGRWRRRRCPPWPQRSPAYGRYGDTCRSSPAGR